MQEKSSLTNVNELFEAFKDLKVLVLGDVMIDAYLWGKVNRISPEAPVPIVAANRKENRLGGAANVALNIKALGAEPYLCAVVGKDDDASIFSTLMHEADMRTDLIFRFERPTTVKTRIIGNNAQMLRVDKEVDHYPTAAEIAKMTESVLAILPEVDVVIFEDYDKGGLSPDFIRSVIQKAQKQAIPVMVDPKKRQFNAYQGADWFKPNMKELLEGLQLPLTGQEEAAEFFPYIQTFLKEQSIKNLLLTRSELGVMWAAASGFHSIPAHIRKIYDVSGAGDTVVSVAALCVAVGLSPYATAEVANLAGGLVCEKVGVVPIDRDRLMNEIKSLKVFENK